LFRKTGDEQYRKFNRSVLEALAGNELGRELLARTAGVAGRELPNILGEAAGLFAFKRPGGASLVGSLTKQAVGAALGETGQQLLQTATGTQRETFGEAAGRVGTEGFISLIGGTVGAGVGGTYNLARGRGLFRVTPEAGKAVRAAPKIGVDEPLPFQMVESPALRLLGRQAQALLSRINRSIRRQQEQINRAVRGLVDRKARSAFIREATTTLDKQSRDLMSGMLASVRHAPKGARDAAVAMRQLVTNWWYASGRVVDELYTTARSIHEPRFDSADLLAKVDGIERGVVGVGREGEPVQVRKLEGPLREAIDRIKSLDPSFAPREGFDSPVDVLREVQRNLQDIALPGPEGARQEQLLAQGLIAEIKKMLDNPIGGDAEFVAAWKAARRAAHKRFSTREQLAVVDLLRTEEPAKFMNALTQPGSFDRLVALTRAGGEPVLNQARSAFMRGLADDPFNILTTLARYDKDTLRLLLPRGGRGAVEVAGEGFARLEKSGLPKAIANQTRVRKFTQDLVSRGDTAGIDALAETMRVAGGKNSAFGKSLRSAIIDEVWKRSHETAVSGPLRGVRKLTAKKLIATLDDFSERGLLQFLNIGEKKFLRNAELVQKVADLASPDAGTSIQAASAAAGIRTLSAGAISTFIENIGVGRLMTNDMGRKLLAGSLRGPMDTAWFKLLGAVAMNIATDIEGEEELPELTAAP
jgi:hypothetical protein